MRLKVFFLSILFFLCTIIVNAQKIEMVSKNLPAYEGTWQYATPTDTFTLVLKKELSVNEKRTKECLIGLYHYKKNGQVLNNYLNKWNDFSLTDENKKKFPVYATNADFKGNYNNIDPNKVEADFYDYNKPRGNRGEAQIELVTGKPNEAVWTIVYRQREAISIGGNPIVTNAQRSHVLPDTMVLKKIK